MIQSFRHRGLKRLFVRGDPTGLRADLVDRIEVVLALLDVAESPLAMRLPGYRLHSLKGDRHHADETPTAPRPGRSHFLSRAARAHGNRGSANPGSESTGSLKPGERASSHFDNHGDPACQGLRFNHGHLDSAPGRVRLSQGSRAGGHDRAGPLSTSDDRAWMIHRRHQHVKQTRHYVMSGLHLSFRCEHPQAQGDTQEGSRPQPVAHQKTLDTV